MTNTIQMECRLRDGRHKLFTLELLDADVERLPELNAEQIVDRYFLPGAFVLANALLEKKPL